MLRTLLLLLLTLLFFTGNAQQNVDWNQIKFKNDSTEQSQVYHIKTADGNTVVGEIVRLDATHLFVETSDLGTIQILRDRIETISINGEETAKKYNRMVGANHYLITPSPYGLEKNEVNLQISEIFLFSSWFGLSDNFTIGGGFTMFPGIDFSDQLFYIIPKLSFELGPKVHSAVQVTRFSAGGEGVTLLSATTGFGEPDKHISIGYTTVLDEDGVGSAINGGLILRAGG